MATSSGLLCSVVMIQAAATDCAQVPRLANRLAIQMIRNAGKDRGQCADAQGGRQRGRGLGGQVGVGRNGLEHAGLENRPGRTAGRGRPMVRRKRDAGMAGGPGRPGLPGPAYFAAAGAAGAG